MDQLTVDILIEIPLTMEEKLMLEDCKQVLQTAALMEEIQSASLSLSIVVDSKMAELNAKYRGLQETTDVLSFPQWEPSEERQVVDGEVALGDIVISWERATQQAIQFGHSLSRELSFLAVHGFLHLLGYNHYDKDTEHEMFKRQEEILTAAGLTR